MIQSPQPISKPVSVSHTALPLFNSAHCCSTYCPMSLMSDLGIFVMYASIWMCMKDSDPNHNNASLNNLPRKGRGCELSSVLVPGTLSSADLFYLIYLI